MFPLIVALVLSLTGADTTLTCQDTSWSTPHSNYDYVAFVISGVYYPATYAETIDGVDLYQYQFPEDGAAPQGELVFTHIVVDGEHLPIADPDRVQCGGVHRLYLPLIGG